METVPLNAAEWSRLLSSSMVHVVQVWAFGRCEGESLRLTSGNASAVATVAHVTYGISKTKAKIEFNQLTIETIGE